MADPYIDQQETLIYGKFAVEQMAEVVVGRIPALDAAVHYCIGEQKKADARMAAVLARQPQPPVVDAETAQANAKDFIARFASHLNSHKAPRFRAADFFDGEAPSIVARRRLVKLVGAVEHIVKKIKAHKDDIREEKLWLGEAVEVHAQLAAAEKAQRSARVARVEMAPEVAAERERWLAVYNANKSIIRGVLGHAGKPELMPLVFDDLAEVHRTTGTSDEPPPAGVEVAAQGGEPVTKP